MGGKPSTVIQSIEATTLIWLDDSVNKLQETIDAQQQLALVLSHFEAFADENRCEDYVKSLSEADRAILIVSGRLGQNFVPRVHSYKQIVAIYVYCGDKQRHQWTTQFPKIRNLAVALKELIGYIRSDQSKGQDNKDDDTVTFSTYNGRVGTAKLASGVNGEFVHSQLFIDCLLRIESTKSDFKELISICERQNNGDDEQLALVQKFNEDYSSDRAVRWYTRQSFVYRMLNRALREQNVHLIYLFRFLIRDLEKQLRDNQCKSPVTVYRGQFMLPEEFNTLKFAKGQLISVNSFLSTSLHRQVAYSFLQQSPDLERVLFEIQADPRLPGIKPFADITTFSYFRKEAEVLFMLGSIFQIVDVAHDRNGVWTVKLQLCGDSSPEMKAIFDYKRSQLQQVELDLIRLGDALKLMGQFSDAKKYYQRCLESLQTNDYRHRASCHYALGNLASDQGDFSASLDHLNKSLEMDRRISKPDDPNIAHTYNSIANVYQNTGDLRRALESYQSALSIFQRAYGDDNLDVAMCLNNIGVLYQKEKDFTKALDHHQRALTIRRNRLPGTHNDIGASYNNIGIVYRNLGQGDQALAHYDRALKIYEVALSPNDPDIAMTHENIGIVQEEQRNWKQALSHYQKAETIYKTTLSPSNPDVVRIAQRIQRVSSKTN